MALAVHFTTNLTRAQYDYVWRQLDAAGLHDPDGRLHHVAWGPDGAIEVVDVWETPAAFDAFGAHLMPILGAIGAEVTPSVNEAHKVVAP